MRPLPLRLLTVLPAALLAACAAEAPAPVAQALPVPQDAQQAVVVRLVDGDTVRLRGRGVGPLPAEPTRTRLLLIDAPETHGQRECFGAEAFARLRELLPQGSTARVQADRDPEDRFGRSLLHVWNEDGVHVGHALVREGYAQVLQLDPNRRYLEVFEQAEQQARQADRGLWAACR